MKSILLFSALTACCAHAAVIIGADTQNTVNTYTTTDTLVTLTAITNVGTGALGNFNSGAGFIGVAGGLNDNGVDDLDGDPATLADREALDMQFAPTVGLSEMSFSWSRVDGPAFTDGITISGFASDPGAVGTGSFATAGNIRWDDTNKILYAETQWTGGFNGTVQFTNLSASAGQTLRLTTSDSDQTGPVAAIGSITYDPVPEPGSLALLAIGGLAFLRRRR